MMNHLAASPGRKPLAAQMPRAPFSAIAGGMPATERRGLSLAELTMAMGVMGIMALAMATFASAVQMSASHTQSNATAVQHARVALDRIQRMMNTATANEQFPGMVTFGETVGLYDFPDSVVIWAPKAPVANPEGLPLFSEVVIYCPNPAHPNELLEITRPGDSRVVPPPGNTGAWLAELASIKGSPTSETVVLTDMLRVAVPVAGGAARGSVRFTRRVLPSDADWNDYESGATDWMDLPWVQNIYGTQTGLRQVWCRIELQLMPTQGHPRTDPDGDRMLTFFGSAARYYELHR